MKGVYDKFNTLLNFQGGSCAPDLRRRKETVEQLPSKLVLSNSRSMNSLDFLVANPTGFVAVQTEWYQTVILDKKLLVCKFYSIKEIG